ncbi:MAG: hypothetical protein PVF43_10700 [Candidatus Eiseniibacteriota bacterium]
MCLALVTPVIAAAGAREPPGLMVHVPLDGSFEDRAALGAVRPEATGTPAFVPGAVGMAALPGTGQKHVGILHVTWLSRLVLRGHTPATGTIMLWFRRPPEDGAGDAPASATILGSDGPLGLAVTVGEDGLTAAFDDAAGNRRRIIARMRPSDGWVHVALGWDAGRGRISVFLQGERLAADDGAAFAMPELPHTFMLGAPVVAIDDFRLFDRLLEADDVRMLVQLGVGDRRQ